MHVSNPAYIPFGRPSFGEHELAAIADVLRSGWIGMGEQTIAFERELREFTSAGHILTVSSCTGALFLSLLAAGVRPGDEVICPSLTWCSSANAALYLGARAIFCDIDAETLVATPQAIRARLSPRTKAVVIVHFGGRAADIDAIRQVLPCGIAIIEDAAHALGARYADGRSIGCSPNLVCFSFYANKNLSTGEGGAIAVADATVAERLAALRQHGMQSNAWSRYIQPTRWPQPLALTELGYKLSYTDLQASIGRVQLRRQSEFHARRLMIAAMYAERLAEKLPELRLQTDLLAPGHARHLFVVTLPEDFTLYTRNELVQRARRRGVGLSVHYAPLHRMPLYGFEGSLPVTDAVVDRLITLPISASLSDEDADRVLRIVEEEFHAIRRRPSAPAQATA
jgi:perosamine synthetase